MADPWTDAEQDRFEVMKHLRLSGRRQVSRMLPRLRELGLLQCQKCDDPANQRKNIDGDTICRTCLNTACVFWARNRDRLRADDAELLELKWELVETKQAIIEKCLARGDTADLKLANEIMNQLARFGGLDLEFAPDPEGDDPEVQNVPRGLAIKRAPARRHADPVN